MVHAFPLFRRQGRWALAAGAALLLAGCGSLDKSAVTVVPTPTATPRTTVGEVEKFVDNVRMKGARLSGQDTKGKKLWSVGATEIRILSDDEKKGERRVRLTGARATLYRAGAAETSFSSREIDLTYSPARTTMVLSGTVEAASQGAWTAERGPVTLRTERIEIDVNARHLMAPSIVTMTQGSTRVEAKSLAADSSLRSAKLKGPVRATSPQGTIAADNAFWNWETAKASAAGHIVVRHERTQVTGDRLKADLAGSRGELTGNVQAVSEAAGASGRGEAKANSVDYDWRAGRLLAREGVTLVRDGATITAARVETDQHLNRAVASGGITLSRGSDHIEASRLEAFDKTTRLVASGGITLTSGDTHVTAARVETFDNMARVVAAGGVRYKAGDLRLQAAHVEVLPVGGNQGAKTGNGRLVAEGGVAFSEGGNTLWGDRLTATVAARRVVHAQWTGNVHGTLKEGGQVRAGLLTWDKGKVEGTGGVEAVRPTMRLRADRFELNPARKLIVVSGNALATGEKKATVRAKEVRYDYGRRRVYASGGVAFDDPAAQLSVRGSTLKATVKPDGSIVDAVVTDVRGRGNSQKLKNKRLF